MEVKCIEHILTGLYLNVCRWNLLIGVLCNLFLLGEWMNSSAGLAFAPHVIRIAVGEVGCVCNDLWSDFYGKGILELVSQFTRV